jgi:hypothetical protein
MIRQPEMTGKSERERGIRNEKGTIDSRRPWPKQNKGKVRGGMGIREH